MDEALFVNLGSVLAMSVGERLRIERAFEGEAEPVISDLGLVVAVVYAMSAPDLGSAEII